MNKFLIGSVAAALVGGGAAIAQATPATKAAPAPRQAKMAQTETRADVQARVGKLFAKLDANKDGYIAKDELSAIEAKRDARLEQRAQRFDPAKIFARLDTNKDGKITAAEAEAVQAQRAAAKAGKAGPAHAGGASALFARADANNDKVITRAEFDAFGSQVHARLEKAAASNGPADRMFAQADANKDGRVSLAELQQNALAHFDRLDLNHDGKVTPDERSRRAPS